MSFWYLIWVLQTHLHAKGFVVPMGGTKVYRTFSNYNAQNITFYQSFSIKVIVIQQKVSCFQIVSIVYWQYKLISLRMRRLHFSLSYVGQVCIIKRPSSKFDSDGVGERGVSNFIEKYFGLYWLYYIHGLYHAIYSSVYSKAKSQVPGM